MESIKLNFQHDFDIAELQRDRGEHFLNSPLWLRVEREVLGNEVEVCQVLRDNRILGQFLISYRNISSNNQLKNIILKNLSLKQMIIQSFGSIFEGLSFLEVESILAGLIKRSKSKKVLRYTMNELKNSDVLDSAKSVGELVKWGSYLINLEVDEDQIWTNLKGSARKSLKKVNQTKLSLKKIETFDDYIKNFVTVKNNSLNDADFKREQSFWNLICNKDIYSFFWVELEGDNLGTLGLYRSGDTVIEISSYLSPKAFEKKIPVQDFLHWELLKYSKNTLGVKFFDLAGFNPFPLNKKEMGIKRFKEKWGGEQYNFYKLQGTNNIWKLLFSQKSKHFLK